MATWIVRLSPGASGRRCRRWLPLPSRSHLKDSLACQVDHDRTVHVDMEFEPLTRLLGVMGLEFCGNLDATEFEAAVGSGTCRLDEVEGDRKLGQARSGLAIPRSGQMLGTHTEKNVLAEMTLELFGPSRWNRQADVGDPDLEATAFAFEPCGDEVH